MLMQCPIHGFAGCCLVSRDLLEVQTDGSLPEILTIEVKNAPYEEAFFRFNLSPKEAAKHKITGNTVPFDIEACEIMEELESMCAFCFEERRQAGQAKST